MLFAARMRFLVMTNDAPSVRSALRALDYLSAHRIPDGKVRIVANRFSRDFGLDVATLQQTLHRSVLATLPADYEAVQRSLIEGKPAVSTSAFGKSVNSLADALRGQKTPPQRTQAETVANAYAALGLKLVSRGKGEWPVVELQAP